jgi:hypothetical protein
MKEETTCRGFDLITFKDLYKKECSIQKSSMGTDTCIWLGIDENNERMHLNIELVKELITYLQRFVDTGELL